MIAGPENAEVNSVNTVKHTIESQKLGYIVDIAIRGTASPLPIMQIQAFVM